MTDRKYSIIVGGFTLLEQGNKFKTVIAPTVVYSDMKYQHVQGFWKIIADNPKVQEACAAFAQAVGDELHKVGNAMGLARGRMTSEELQEITELREKLK